MSYPECGADFMAGTICSDVPGHDGPHNTSCQTCHGDWLMQTCSCIKYCIKCHGERAIDHSGLCDDCFFEAYRCPERLSSAHGHVMQCELLDGHGASPHEFSHPTTQHPYNPAVLPSNPPVSDEEVAEVLGVAVEVVQKRRS